MPSHASSVSVMGMQTVVSTIKPWTVTPALAPSEEEVCVLIVNTTQLDGFVKCVRIGITEKLGRI